MSRRNGGQRKRKFRKIRKKNKVEKGYRPREKGK